MPKRSPFTLFRFRDLSILTIFYYSPIWACQKVLEGNFSRWLGKSYLKHYCSTQTQIFLLTFFGLVTSNNLDKGHQSRSWTSERPQLSLHWMRVPATTPSRDACDNFTPPQLGATAWRLKNLLNKLKHLVEPGILWFFSNEKKNFIRIHCTHPEWPVDCRRPSRGSLGLKTKSPQTVIVYSCVSSDGDVMPPRVFKGIIRPFELEEIYLLYYLIDAGEFSYSNDMH